MTLWAFRLEEGPGVWTSIPKDLPTVPRILVTYSVGNKWPFRRPKIAQGNLALDLWPSNCP